MQLLLVEFCIVPGTSLTGSVVTLCTGCDGRTGTGGVTDVQPDNVISNPDIKQTLLKYMITPLTDISQILMMK